MAKKHVILFAGTTEGRILANWLDEQSGVTGIVCVATEYGAELLEEEMSLKHLTVPVSYTHLTLPTISRV